MEQLSERIRKIREAHGLTQTEVANRMNISCAAYGKMERKANNSTFETLTRIADSICVSVIFLLDTDNECYLET